MTIHLIANAEREPGRPDEEADRRADIERAEEVQAALLNLDRKNDRDHERRGDDPVVRKQADELEKRRHGLSEPRQKVGAPRRPRHAPQTLSAAVVAPVTPSVSRCCANRRAVRWV